MKRYTFNENIFLVHGYTNCCLYDLQHGRLVHISKDYSELITKVVEYPEITTHFDIHEREKLACLLEMNPNR